MLWTLIHYERPETGPFHGQLLNGFVGLRSPASSLWGRLGALCAGTGCPRLPALPADTGRACLWQDQSECFWAFLKEAEENLSRVIYMGRGELVTHWKEALAQLTYLFKLFSALGNVTPHGARKKKALLWQGFLHWRGSSLKTLFFLEGETSAPGKSCSKKLQTSVVFVGVSPLGLHFLGCQKHIDSSLTGISYCLEFPPGPCFLGWGAGVWESCQDLFWLLKAPLFQVVLLFPVQQHSTIFQELKEWHVQTDPDKRSRSESVQVLQTQTPHASSLSLSLFMSDHGWSNSAAEVPVGSWTNLVSHQILWYSYTTAQWFSE